LNTIFISASEKSYNHFYEKNYFTIYNLVIFFSCGSDDSGDSNNCPTPGGLNVYNLTNTTASLSWNSNVNSSLYQVEYGVLGFSIGNGTTLTVPETYADVTNLQAQTQYAFYARVFCNETNGYSNWAGPFSFVTLASNPYCNEPTNLSVDLYPDSVTHEYIDLTWSDGEYGGAQIQYGTQGFTFGNGTIETITDSYPSYKRIEGLNADTSYDFYVRNSCNASGYSTWTGPFTYSTLEESFNLNCIDPAGFTSTSSGTDINGSKYFDFTWTYESSQNSWEVAVVTAGSTFSTSSVIATSFEPVRLSYGGMTSGQAYDFYIRANCGGTDGFSDWVGPVTVTAQ
jgi:hypothetical protein